MNNLFIMHTQYNLILSTGITSRNINDNNVLVLYAEFSVTSEFVEQLNKIFSKVIVVNDTFRKFNSEKEELKFIKSSVKKCKEIWKEKFDRVYMSQERIFDLVLWSNAKEKNKNALCYNVEEDAYYSINNKYNDEDFKIKLTFKNRVKRFFHRCYLGYSYNFLEPHYFYGMISEYAGSNMLFPSLARKEICGRNNLEITKEELIYGIKKLYSNRTIQYPSGKKYLLMFFDLMNRYNNKEVVQNVIKNLIEKAKNKNYTILFKYHPRETEKFEEFSEFFEIDKVIPAEKVLFDLIEKEVVVFGNATTSVIVASKLGYKVNSICKIEAPENNRMHKVMSLMGINCIKNYNDIEI